MALTTQQNGTTVGGLSNQARASWWNDFKDLLTGVMNDQPATLNYRPGSGTTPTLTLKGDGFGPLLKAFKPDNTTQAALLDSNGNLTILGNFTLSGSGGVTWNGTLGGANKAVLTMNPTDVSTKNWGLYYNVSDNSLSFFDATDGVTALRLFATGNVTVAGLLTSAGATFSSGVTITATGLIVSAANQGVELGAKASANTPFLDFNSSGFSNDYDARLIATGGTTGTVGAGTLNVQAGALQFNSKQVMYAQAGITGKFAAQTTAPTSPTDGDLWLDMSVVLS